MVRPESTHRGEPDGSMHAHDIPGFGGGDAHFAVEFFLPPGLPQDIRHDTSTNIGPVGTPLVRPESTH